MAASTANSGSDSPNSRFRRLRFIDSHTGGEPTRLITDGAPDLGGGPVAAQLNRLRSEFDWLRSAAVNEPRGSDAVVGALLCPPSEPSCVSGVIYFNNVGYLGMCGHGTIGVIASLAFMGQISEGAHKLETPAGVVTATLNRDGSVTVKNVRSYRHLANVSVDVNGYGRVTGDVAWGGNWFFLVKEHALRLSFDNIEQLTDFTWSVRHALTASGITGREGAEIDHVELFGTSSVRGVDSKNFVLCPGKAYDRSPCGTGTSAKAACLYADGKLTPGKVWRQESIVGSVFDVSIEVKDGAVIPSITGNAYVSAEGDLVLDERDPFRFGIVANTGSHSLVEAGD
ncbi:MAG TPA: proline racemase family protein [Terriglobales bacterium]|nr:proline racemase family protein [Terriglobales bacterium]